MYDLSHLLDFAPTSPSSSVKSFLLALQKCTPERSKRKFLVKYIVKAKDVDGSLARILQGDPSLRQVDN